ncbi:hypothetical protein [Paenibacillus sp. WC2504]|uniref:hypothetical protein n=1 Tax=Paenibacillus sp. WC2504 TaxID=3461403 RepID=UPI0040459BD1
MKKTLIVISLFACSFLLVLYFNNNGSASAATEKQINDSFAAIEEKINKEVSLRSEISYSSNPYDYIKNNDDFENIIKLGNDAIPILDQKLSTSEKNGLQEYITAIAIERIAKVDLKGTSTFWESGKDFSTKWKAHIKSIPLSIDTILLDTQTSSGEKVKKIIELGTPAIPFIADKIESGDESIFPALLELTKGTENIIVDGDKKEWVVSHKSEFKSLKDYVLQK